MTIYKSSVTTIRLFPTFTRLNATVKWQLWRAEFDPKPILKVRRNTLVQECLGLWTFYAIAMKSKCTTAPVTLSLEWKVTYALSSGSRETTDQAASSLTYKSNNNRRCLKKGNPKVVQCMAEVVYASSPAFCSPSVTPARHQLLVWHSLTLRLRYARDTRMLGFEPESVLALLAVMNFSVPFDARAGIRISPPYPKQHQLRDRTAIRRRVCSERARRRATSETENGSWAPRWQAQASWLHRRRRRRRRRRRCRSTTLRRLLDLPRLTPRLTPRQAATGCGKKWWLDVNVGLQQ